MDINQESFDALLNWLSPDRDEAGQKYEIIRRGLIRILQSHGVSNAESWADETINRVAQKVPASFEGEPIRYFFAFARNIIHEAKREREIPTEEFTECVTNSEERSDVYECLVKCINSLPEENRQLILDYYVYSGHYKIEVHKEIAEELGISKGALRNRAFQIRTRLEQAILRELAAKQN